MHTISNQQPQPSANTGTTPSVDSLAVCQQEDVGGFGPCPSHVELAADLNDGKDEEQGGPLPHIYS